MDAGLFSKFLSKHHNYKKELKVEEGVKSVFSYYSLYPRETMKFPVKFKDDEQIKKISHNNVSPYVEGNEATFLYWGKPKVRAEIISELSFWSSNRNTQMQKVEGEDLYHITFELPEDARLEYKVVIDGNWIFDPLNPLRCDNGIGGENSYLLMGKYKKVNEIYPREGIPHGEIQEYEFSGKAIEGRRKVYVYLPPGYEENSEKRYPTMYFHDGGDYIYRANTVNTINNLLAEGKIEPLIGVFINPINRLNEYMYNIKYSRMIVEEIIPKVDSRFRTKAVAEERAIMGASLGGIISFFTAYNFPESFRNVAGQSSSFLYLEKEISLLIRNSREKFNVYMDVGLFESLIYPNRRVKEIYQEKNFRYYYQEISEGHTWSNWGAHVKDALLFFWGNKEEQEGNNGNTFTENTI